MMAGDVDHVSAIERSALTPWSGQMLVAELCYAPGVRLVAEDGWPAGRIVGWCGARLLAPQAELLKIVVDDGYRRQGIGGCLIDALCHFLQGAGIDELFLEVREKNHPALAFYRRYGFAPVGKRPGYYSEPKDDALLFRRALGVRTTNYLSCGGNSHELTA